MSPWPRGSQRNWTGVTGVVPRAGLSREPLTLKHTLLGLKYGAKVDKVLRVRPSQNGGSRPPTLRTTQTPSFLNEALRPDARLRHAVPETKVSCSFVDGFHASPWAWGPRALLWGPVWGPGQRRPSSRSRICRTWRSSSGATVLDCDAPFSSFAGSQSFPSRRS